MNNRWIYGVELVVFGLIALRGGWVAVRGQAWWAKLLGALALLAGTVSAVLLTLFALNVPIAPLLHSSALIGTLLVVLHQTLRVAHTLPGWTAVLVGVYGAFAFIIPRRRPKPKPPDEVEEPDDGEDDIGGEHP